MKVFVVGASNIDVIARSSEMVVAADSNIGTVEKDPGGVGRNIASALNAMGFEVTLLTALADDDYGRLISADLERQGIRLCQEPFCESDDHTGVYCCIMDADGTLVCAVNDMAINKHLNPELVAKHLDAINSADYVVFDANLPQETINYLSKLDVKLIADCVSTLKAPKLQNCLEDLYLLKANFLEACTLAETGGVELNADGLDEVMQALVAKGLRRAIISLGGEGAFCYEVSGTGTRGYEAKVPEGLEVVSTNGCGDVLIAAFLRAMSDGLPIEDALNYGQAASGINAGSMEAVSPNLSYENVKKKAEERYEQIH